MGLMKLWKQNKFAIGKRSEKKPMAYGTFLNLTFNVNSSNATLNAGRGIELILNLVLGKEW